MDGDSLKEGLEGLSKIEGLTEVIYGAVYWVAVIFIILFVAYLFSCLNCYLIKRSKGTLHIQKDDFLDD